MKNKKEVIFVQGWGDYTDGIWPNWLGGELAKCGFDFKYLLMPNVMCPEIHEWLDYLRAQNIKISQNTYFVGHSLGCITIARFLETLPEGTKAGGCVFVSGFCSIPKIPLLDSFCFLPLDYEKVKQQARDFVVVLSDDDHLIPPESSQEFAAKLGARVITEHGKGHFKSDVKEVPCVLNSILEMDQMAEEIKDIKKLKAKVRI